MNARVEKMMEELVVFYFKYDNEFRVYKVGTDFEDVRDRFMKKDSCRLATAVNKRKVINQLARCSFERSNDTQTIETKNFEITKRYYGNSDGCIVYVKVK